MRGTIAIDVNETLEEHKARPIRSEVEARADCFPEEYWMNVWADVRGVPHCEVVFTDEGEMLADINDVPRGWHYVHTVKISKSGNPLIANSICVNLQDEADQYEHDQERDAILEQRHIDDERSAWEKSR